MAKGLKSTLVRLLREAEETQNRLELARVLEKHRLRRIYDLPNVVARAGVIPSRKTTN